MIPACILYIIQCYTMYNIVGTLFSVHSCMYQSPCLGLNYMKFIIPDWTSTYFCQSGDPTRNTQLLQPLAMLFTFFAFSRWLFTIQAASLTGGTLPTLPPSPLPVTAVLPVAHAPRAQPNSLIFLKWIHKNTPDWQQSARFWKSLKISISLNPSVTDSLSRCEIYYSRLESGVVNIDYR